MSDDVLIAIRAVHFAASVALGGTLLFRPLVAAPALRAAAGESIPGVDVFHGRLTRLLWISLVVALLSGAGWLLALSGAIAGQSWTVMWSDDLTWTVLTETRFGHAWTARLIAALAIAGIMVGLRGAIIAHWRDGIGAVLAAVFVGMLAFSGHAGAAPGLAGELHLISDIAHLVAVAVWLGGLVPLALLLAPAARSGGQAWGRIAIAATRRFSVCGMTSVAVLMVSGLANSWYLVGSLSALVETDYGRLLLAKLGVFAAMLAVAANNLTRLTPRLPDIASIRQLQRNSLIEIALGLIVIIIVSWLGTMVPALHMPAAHMPGSHMPGSHMPGSHMH